MMRKLTISRPHNYGEGLRNLPMGLTLKSLGLLWGFYKIYNSFGPRIAMGKIRAEEIGFNFLSTIFPWQYEVIERSRSMNGDGRSI